VYQPGFLSEDEAGAVLAVVEAMPYEEVVLRGRPARRTVSQYGYQYDYRGWGITPTGPLVPVLAWLRDRAGALAGVDPEALAQALVIRYPAGAGIGWHRDAPAFGPTVVGVSLLGPARMRFQRPVDEERSVYEQALEPRSAYVLSGPARSVWQHSIPAVRAARYSITFRTVA
jgi:alkylated DNA repair dioxygenase AlkB